jgi:hypothetical protein
MSASADISDLQPEALNFWVGFSELHQYKKTLNGNCRPDTEVQDFSLDGRNELFSDIHEPGASVTGRQASVKANP